MAVTRANITEVLSATTRKSAVAESSHRLGAVTGNPKKILTVFAGLVAFAASSTLSGCSPATLEEDATASAMPTVTALDGPVNWPLTGVLRSEDGRIPDDERHPAVAVKVENTVAARPQSGLEQADIIFEEMVEGGLTRFNAVFHSNAPQEIGPVRSVRPMDIGIAKPFNGYLVFSGGTKKFLQRVAESGITTFDEDTALGAAYRVNWQKAPHNLYLSLPSLFDKARSGAVEEPESYFEFAAPCGADSAATEGSCGEATAVAQGKAATQLNIPFPSNKTSFSWDGKRWLRADDGAASTSRAGQRLGGENVVVLQTHTISSGVFDKFDNPVPETVFTGGGTAWVATGGKVLQCKWSKDSDAAPLVLLTETGDAVTLAPGQTWVELLTNSAFSYS